MCSIETHDREHPTINDNESSGDGIPIPYISTKYMLV